MDFKKYIFLGLLLLLTLTIIICCVSNRASKKVFVDFAEISESIENGDGDVNLTIYYMGSHITTRIPLSVDNLIYGITSINDKKKRDETNGFFEYKVVVNSDKLEEHINLLNQICNAVLIPVEHKTVISARIYFVFESKTSGKIFEVAMWGAQLDDESNYIEPCIIVNGIAINVNEIFYDVIIPFLPEDAVKELEIYIGRRTWDE